MPFGHEKLHLVALPARVNSDGTLKVLTTETDFTTKGHFDSFDWFQETATLWERLKKRTSSMSLIERYDYQSLLSKQRPHGEIKVLYTASGVHIAACVLDTRDTLPEVYQRKTQGFVVDIGMYFSSAASLDEAHYLCSLLNAPSVDTAIKAYQSRGKGFVGERHVGRTPFEACAIPPFDATNADHLELARLSREAHSIIEALKASGVLSGGVVSIRRQARAAAAEQIAAIDGIARRVLGL